MITDREDEKATELANWLGERIQAMSLVWMQPHVVSADSTYGEGASLEWWYGKHTLSIFVQGDKVEWLRAWGPHIHNEMSDGALNNNEELLVHYQWLLDGIEKPTGDVVPLPSQR